MSTRADSLAREERQPGPQGKAAIDGDPGGRTKLPEALLWGVVAYFDLLKVILFGSQASGTAGPDSGWDLLVVVDDGTPDEKVTLRAGFEARRDWHGAADVVPCRRSAFEAKRDVINSLAWIADTQGIVVHERALGPRQAT